MMSEEFIIRQNKSDLGRDLISKSFNFLKTNNVGVGGFHSREKVFSDDRTQSVDVSRGDFHRGGETNKENSLVTDA